MNLFFLSAFCLTLLSPMALAATPETHWSPPLRATAAGAPSPSPRLCASCHAPQFAAWSGSRHAQAFSPGLRGQLQAAASCDEGRACLECHAPLAEQKREWSDCQQPSTTWSEARTRDSLSGSGVSCPVCHLRGGRIIASTRHQSTGTPEGHGVLQREAWFGSSALCGPCHQFPASGAVNGKPVQNTLLEWQESPAAQAGVSCQGCHLPDGQHLFRGIHDPGMVESGLEVQVFRDGGGVVFELRSVGIGHAFPTYTVPRVTLMGEVVDQEGRPLPGGERHFVIQRELEQVNGQMREIRDTRLKPGERARISVPWEVNGRTGEEIRFALRVEPDHHYAVQVYPPLLGSLPPGAAREAIQQAADEASRSPYRLFERRVRRQE